MNIGYGLPYKGSKNKLASKIFKLFPRKKNFYDLFCGGCAMTHYGMLHNKFKNFFINDLNPMCPNLFTEAINGKYRDEKRWISREDFFKLKDTDAYVAICWSFGNNLVNYLYCKEIEPYKKACYYAVVFDDFSFIKELCPQVYDATKKALDGCGDIKKRQSVFKSVVMKELKQLENWSVVENNLLYKSVLQMQSLERLQSLESLERLQRLQSLQSLESLERLQRLQSLESLESLERLQSFSTDYQNVKIYKDSVIYCDIPYENTDGYTTGGFDYERFYSWCEKQTEPLFISSYRMPEDRFVCIATFKHRSTLSATANNKVLEKVFIPKHQASSYSLPESLFDFDDFKLFEL